MFNYLLSKKASFVWGGLFCELPTIVRTQENSVPTQGTLPGSRGVSGRQCSTYSVPRIWYYIVILARITLLVSPSQALPCPILPQAWYTSKPEVEGKSGPESSCSPDITTGCEQGFKTTQRRGWRYRQVTRLPGVGVEVALPSREHCVLIDHCSQEKPRPVQLKIQGFLPGTIAPTFHR